MILHNLISHTIYKQDDSKPEAKGRWRTGMTGASQHPQSAGLMEASSRDKCL